MAKLDYEKANRRESVSRRPAWTTDPITPNQREYIKILAINKGQRVNMPKTKGGAANVIERLRGLPNRFDSIGAVVEEPPKQEEPTWQEDIRVALRQELKLKDTTARHFVALCMDADPVGAVFFLEDLIGGLIPVFYDEDREAVAALMARFVTWRQG